MSKGKTEDLNGKTYGSLKVVGEALYRNGHQYRTWPTQCLRPVHGEGVVIRWTTITHLKSGNASTLCCLECGKADREGAKRKWQVQEEKPREMMPVRGCAELCRPPWHQPECPTLGLFRITAGTARQPEDQSLLPSRVW